MLWGLWEGTFHRRWPRWWPSHGRCSTSKSLRQLRSGMLMETLAKAMNNLNIRVPSFESQNNHCFLQATHKRTKYFRARASISSHQIDVWVCLVQRTLLQPKAARPQQAGTIRLFVGTSCSVRVWGVVGRIGANWRHSPGILLYVSFYWVFSQLSLSEFSFKSQFCWNLASVLGHDVANNPVIRFWRRITVSKKPECKSLFNHAVSTTLLSQHDHAPKTDLPQYFPFFCTVYLIHAVAEFLPHSAEFLFVKLRTSPSIPRRRTFLAVWEEEEERQWYSSGSELTWLIIHRLRNRFLPLIYVKGSTS